MGCTRPPGPSEGRPPPRHARVPRNSACPRPPGRARCASRGRSSRSAGSARDRPVPRDALRRDAGPRRPDRSCVRARERPARAPGGARRVPARGSAVAPARHAGTVPRAAAPLAAASGRRSLHSVRSGCFPFTSAPVRGEVRSPRVVSDKHLRETEPPRPRGGRLQGSSRDRKLRASGLPVLRTTEELGGMTP